MCGGDSDIVCVASYVNVVGWRWNVVHVEVEECGAKYGALGYSVWDVFCFG